MIENPKNNKIKYYLGLFIDFNIISNKESAWVGNVNKNYLKYSFYPFFLKNTLK